MKTQSYSQEKKHRLQSIQVSYFELLSKRKQTDLYCKQEKNEEKYKLERLMLDKTLRLSFL